MQHFGTVRPFEPGVRAMLEAMRVAGIRKPSYELPVELGLPLAAAVACARVARRPAVLLARERSFANDRDPDGAFSALMRSFVDLHQPAGRRAT